MSETKLTHDQAQAVRTVLSFLVVRDRTGELGLLHGADRFVSNQRIFKKPEREVLNSLAKKLGLLAGVNTYKG